MPRPKSLLPALTAQTVGDEQKLWDLIQRVLLEEPGHRRASRKIIRMQEGLKAVVTDEAWKTYLAIEDEVNWRRSRDLIVVARWAFEQGTRHGARPRAGA